MDRPRASQVICTICSKNYLHFARTLMHSVERTHPDWDRVVLLADRVDGHFDPAGEPFRIIEISDLDIPNVLAFCFRYTILELNTAAKPWLLDRLLGTEGYQRAIYLDPDIWMFRRMEEVEAALDAGAFCVLTPHLTGPIEDERKPSEIDVLRAGTYNLGFLALQRHPELDEFLRWWQARLERHCVVDMGNGLFVDQKWMDLVPGMREDVHVLRHEGYNVAYWNLPHREVTIGPAGPQVNGVPLVFFHFSGLDPRAPRDFSKHQDRYRLESLGSIRTLVESYCEAVRANGLAECARWPYAFAQLADGTKIPSVLRSYLRRHPELEALAPRFDPFALPPDFFNQTFDPALGGDPLVSRLVHAVWEDHPELRAAFPDPGGEHREALATWFAENRLLDFQLDGVWVRPVEESIRRLRGRSKMVQVVVDPWLAALRRAGKPLVPKTAKTWLRELVHPRRGQGDWVQRTTRAILRTLPFAVKHRLRSLILPVGATLPQRPTARPAPGVLRFGFHEYDHDVASAGLAWIGEEATIRVPQADLGPVRVRGSYSPGLFVRSGGSPQTKLEVLVNGESIGTKVLEREGPFEEVFHAANGSSGSPVTVSLRANQSFVPARVGLGEDLRRLSIEIGRIDLGSRTLVDFSNRSARREEVSPMGINIVGYLRSELGIGESARLGILAADAAGLAVSLVDFSEGCSSRLGDERYVHRLGTSNPQPVNIFYVNADQFPLVYSTLGPSFFQNRYNIGFWLWELPEFPSEWLGSFGLVDEVWAPSRFCQDAIAEKSPVPVFRMPIPIQVDLERCPPRSELGLPEDRFLFLTMWDMHSFQGRKNPEAVLDAYQRAFSGRGDVGLVIKTMNTSTYPEEWARFKERIDQIDGIFVIDAVLTRQAVWGLEAVCDCFVSLHRSEGYGIVLAECMALGKPVIATGWSGNIDFTREDNSCLVRYRLIQLDRDHGPYRRGQTWADPDPEHAAHHMRRLVDDAPFRTRIAAAGQRTIRDEFSPEAVGRQYVRRLEALHHWRS